MIAAALVTAIALCALGFLVGRSTAPVPEAAPPVAVVTPSPSPAPVIPGPLALERGELLALADQAADAMAAGAQLPASVTEAAGRRFDLVLPFGCRGPSIPESDADLRWRYDPEEEVLRITVTPHRWRAREWGLAAASAVSAPALQGFWITWPWSSAPRCPAGAHEPIQTGSEPMVLPGQTLAIARLIEGEDRGRNRPFELVKRMAPDAFDPARGFHLRVLGRIDPAPGSAPVRCVQPGGSEQRPLCLFVATFTELRIENPKDGQVLATWPVDQVVRDGN